MPDVLLELAGRGEEDRDAAADVLARVVERVHIHVEQFATVHDERRHEGAAFGCHGYAAAGIAKMQ